MDYVSERVTNIANLEKIIDECYMQAQLLQKRSPHKEDFIPLIEGLKKASSFEFEIERRKTRYCE